MNGHFLNGNVNHGNPFLGFFEDVGDLNHVQHENENHGWEMPPPPSPQANNMGWGPWLQ